ncbi:hypothetical protein JRO89_XS02G0057300 [Xanthoceras sorbifolium]|uniref:TF-B3 domain-containing protein n=1 Tax=Xanthoceras sorbifolium TaxID=99658 RepID=A0ABQ8IFF3_9ROSI|nr:hypothetical protein JRO89_XS02G0057300 [Xanthoceras sorbifolium]
MSVFSIETVNNKQKTCPLLQEEPSEYLIFPVTKEMTSTRRTEPISSSSLAEAPSHFFKIILPANLEEKKLRIPEKFVRKFGDELSDIATIRVPNGRVWYVKLTKEGKEIWFHDGWHDFVKYHSICAGYFLVFKYEKESNFHGLIFDKTACEVQYPYYCEQLENDEQNPVQRDKMKIDNSVERMGCRTPNPPLSSLRRTYRSVECDTSLERKKFKNPNYLDSSTQDEHEEEVEIPCRFHGSASARRRRVTTEERERAIEAAKAFEPANPFCRAVLQPSYVGRRCIMFLPSCFSEKHLKGVSSFIKLQLSDGKQWPVRCLYRGCRAKLGQGWYEFTLENNLGEGDVCVFEVLKSRDVVLNVTPFRILESAESVDRLSSVSALGSNRCQKCVASLETPHKHDFETRIKRCKIEEVERIYKSDVIGDVSELRKTTYEVVTISSENKSECDEHEFLALLEDMGISVKRNFRNIAAEARERTINIVRYLKPKSPSFMVILESRSIDRSYLYVPINFASKYLSRDAIIIKLEVSDGREWPVQLTWRQNGSVDLTKGWGGFSKENNLEGGDICLFEIIRMEDIRLKVSVFHSSVVLDSD